MQVSDLVRSGGFEFLPQAQKELDKSSVSPAVLLGDILSFQEAWTAGASQQVLNARFQFQVAHHAVCEKKGLLLYEIYIHRGRYRAIVAWFKPEGPGFWVAVFKKEGKSQSKLKTLAAGDRAVREWRFQSTQGGDTNE